MAMLLQLLRSSNATPNCEHMVPHHLYVDHMPWNNRTFVQAMVLGQRQPYGAPQAAPSLSTMSMSTEQIVKLVSGRCRCVHASWTHGPHLPPDASLRARTRGAPQSVSSLSTMVMSLEQVPKLAPSGWLVSSCTAPAYSYVPLWSAGMHGLAARVSSHASTAARPAISPKPR